MNENKNGLGFPETIFPFTALLVEKKFITSHYTMFPAFIYFVLLRTPCCTIFLGLWLTCPFSLLQLVIGILFGAGSVFLREDVSV